MGNQFSETTSEVTGVESAELLLRHCTLGDVESVEDHVKGKTIRCKVLRIIDGDTFVAAVPFEGSVVSLRVRMFGIDAPELRPRKTIDPDRRNKIRYNARKAAQWLSNRIEGRLVDLSCHGLDNFGRLLATVLCESHKSNVDGESTTTTIVRHDVCQEMIQNQLARPRLS